MRCIALVSAPASYSQTPQILGVRIAIQGRGDVGFDGGRRGPCHPTAQSVMHAVLARFQAAPCIALPEINGEPDCTKSPLHVAEKRSIRPTWRFAAGCRLRAIRWAPLSDWRASARRQPNLEQLDSALCIFLHGPRHPQTVLFFLLIIAQFALPLSPAITKWLPSARCPLMAIRCSSPSTLRTVRDDPASRALCAPRLTSTDDILVERRRLGQTDLTVKPGQVGITSATKAENLGIFDYAHLRVPLPRNLKGSGIFSLQRNHSYPDSYFLMVIYSYRASCSMFNRRCSDAAAMDTSAQRECSRQPSPGRQPKKSSKSASTTRHIRQLAPKRSLVMCGYRRTKVGQFLVKVANAGPVARAATQPHDLML